MTKGLANYLDQFFECKNFQYNFSEWNIKLIDQSHEINSNERQLDNTNCGLIALAQCFMLATTGTISSFTQKDFNISRDIYATFLVDQLSSRVLCNSFNQDIRYLPLSKLFGQNRRF